MNKEYWVKSERFISVSALPFYKLPPPTDPMEKNPRQFPFPYQSPTKKQHTPQLFQNPTQFFNPHDF